jgi:hypothetical protein
MNQQAHELKKEISYYMIGGNSLKPFLSEKALKDLKAILDQLKGILSDKE